MAIGQPTEIIYCVLTEAEGLLARQVLETIDLIFTSTNFSTDDIYNQGIQRFTENTVVRNWVDGDWEYYYTPTGEIIDKTSAIWDYMNLNQIRTEFFNFSSLKTDAEREAAGLVPFADLGITTPNHLTSYLADPSTFGDPWEFNRWFRTYYDYKVNTDGYTKTWVVDTSDYSEWLYNYPNFEYPYLLNIGSTSGNYTMDKTLRSDVNKAIRYMGEYVIGFTNFESWIRRSGQNEEWASYSSSSSETKTHIWTTAKFEGENNYYKLNESLDDRRINVLKDVDAKIIEIEARV